jgi:hypothetical protein
MHEFKEGAAYIAIKAGVPIVPVALIGTRAVLPFNSGTFHPGRVRLRIGDPIPTTGLTLRDRGALTVSVRETGRAYATRQYRNLMRPFVLLLAPALLLAQMDIREYDPKTSLVVPQHQVTRAKYPFIDVHHHPRVRTPADVDQLIKDMDGINLRTLVNLSGGSGDRLKSNVILLKERYPDRFAVFANWDYNNVDDPGYGHRIAQQLEQDFQNGARGLKIFKNFGMDAKDTRAAYPRRRRALRRDFRDLREAQDPGADHTAEPQPFFDPIDKKNERWRELQEFPGRARPAEKYPSWKTLMDEQHRMFERHPRTTFINAPLGWLGQRPGAVGTLDGSAAEHVHEIGRGAVRARPPAAHGARVSDQVSRTG